MCIFALKMHVMWFEIGHSQNAQIRAFAACSLFFQCYYGYYLESSTFANNDGSQTANSTRSMPCNLINNSYFGKV